MQKNDEEMQTSGRGTSRIKRINFDDLAYEKHKKHLLFVQNRAIKPITQLENVIFQFKHYLALISPILPTLSSSSA